MSQNINFNQDHTHNIHYYHTPFIAISNLVSRVLDRIACNDLSIGRHMIRNSYQMADSSKAKCPRRDCHLDKTWVGKFQGIASSSIG